MDDVDFSQHKLLKNDMEAVTELKKEPYDDFSLDKWNMDSDLAKSNLPRLVSLWSEALRSYTIHMCLSIMPSAVRQKLWKQSGQI